MKKKKVDKCEKCKKVLKELEANPFGLCDRCWGKKVKKDMEKY